MSNKSNKSNKSKRGCGDCFATAVVILIIIGFLFLLAAWKGPKKFGYTRVDGCLFYKTGDSPSATYCHDSKCDNPKHFDTINGCLYKKDYYSDDNTTVYAYRHSDQCKNDIAHPEKYKNK